MNNRLHNIFVLIFSFIFLIGIFAVYAVRPGEVLNPTFSPEEDNVVFTEITSLSLSGISGGGTHIEGQSGAFGGYDIDPNHSVTTPSLWTDIADVLQLNADTICLSGDCRTTWPAPTTVTTGGTTVGTGGSAQNIVTAMGFVKSNSPLPIPPGFTPNQCSWIVSSADMQYAKGDERVVCYTDNKQHNPQSVNYRTGIFGAVTLSIQGDNHVPGYGTLNTAVDPRSGVIVHCDEVKANDLVRGPSGEYLLETQGVYNPANEAMANYLIICGGTVNLTVTGTGPTDPLGTSGSTLELTF